MPVEKVISSDWHAIFFTPTIFLFLKRDVLLEDGDPGAEDDPVAEGGPVAGDDLLAEEDAVAEGDQVEEGNQAVDVLTNVSAGSVLADVSNFKT